MALSKKSNEAHYVFVAKYEDIKEAPGGCLSVQVDNHTIALFYHNSKVYAIDNRCPHMGFPLNQGSVKDGIIVCHWHHARFDLGNGGTFDQWAGDVPSFPIQIRKGNKEDEIWLDISQYSSLDSEYSHKLMLLQNGLKQNISLMIAKAVIAMIDETPEKAKENKKKEGETSAIIMAFRLGIDYGTHFKQSGWGQGLTILTCMMNIIPYLDPKDKALALYHGLSAVAQDCASSPPRFQQSPLPKPWPDLSTLKRWFRQFIESRDAPAAERCIVTAVRFGANSHELSDMLFAAATDHRFLDIGHIVDFTNKALEALDIVGWNNNMEIVEAVLSSLVLGFTNAERMEESNAWRYPIDLIAILENAFNIFPCVLKNSEKRKEEGKKWPGRNKLVAELLGDNPPQLIVAKIIDALKQGVDVVELSGAVTYAAALRITKLHTRNEFSDWDAALHTFTFANAVNQGLRRTPTPELTRGIFDAAMRIYLNRFLNIPSANLPKPISNNRKKFEDNTKKLLNGLPNLLDKQQQINQTGQLVADYIYNGGKSEQLLSTIGNLLLREDRNFHCIQMVEGTFRQYFTSPYTKEKDNEDEDEDERVNIMVASSRYLAAHSPTMRSQGRTFQIANQLYQGDHLFESY
jgi:nitrite reductase/ring-hydroxylating ferredoxin subunit